MQNSFILLQLTLLVNRLCVWDVHPFSYSTGPAGRRCGVCSPPAEPVVRAGQHRLRPWTVLREGQISHGSVFY